MGRLALPLVCSYGLHQPLLLLLSLCSKTKHIECLMGLGLGFLFLFLSLFVLQLLRNCFAGDDIVKRVDLDLKTLDDLLLAKQAKQLAPDS